MESELPPTEATTELPSTQNEEEPNNELNTSTNAAAPIATTSGELAATPVPSVLKDAQKSNSKKPKKRKPKVPRDVTAPRQPLTGNIYFYQHFY